MTQSPGANATGYVAFLKQMAAKEPLIQPASAAGLAYFRAHIMCDPDGLRRKILGANALRLRALAPRRRSWLKVLDASPDLLSPIGELRYEPTHSRLIGFYLDPRGASEVADKCASALLRLFSLDEECVVGVRAEHWTTAGRVDVRLETESTIIFIEAKVDASEGKDQLKGYREVLQKECKSASKKGVLVYLALPNDVGATLSTEPDHRLSFEAVLEAWLPVAATPGSAAGHLARYLKSLALLLDYAEPGEFHDWSFATQRAAIELVEGIDDGED